MRCLSLLYNDHSEEYDKTFQTDDQLFFLIMVVVYYNAPLNRSKSKNLIIC